MFNEPDSGLRALTTNKRLAKKKERFAREKHSSLLRKLKNCGCKRPYMIGPRVHWVGDESVNLYWYGEKKIFI